MDWSPPKVDFQIDSMDSIMPNQPVILNWLLAWPKIQFTEKVVTANVAWWWPWTWGIYLIQPIGTSYRNFRRPLMLSIDDAPILLLLSIVICKNGGHRWWSKEVHCLRQCPKRLRIEPTTVEHHVQCNPVPEEATAAGYPDDVALVVIAKHVEYTELYSREAISAVRA